MSKKEYAPNAVVEKAFGELGVFLHEGRQDDAQGALEDLRKLVIGKEVQIVPVQPSERPIELHTATGDTMKTEEPFSGKVKILGTAVMAVMGNGRRSGVQGLVSPLFAPEDGSPVVKIHFAHTKERKPGPLRKMLSGLRARHGYDKI